MKRAGKIIRNPDGSVNRIVEFKDATAEEEKSPRLIKLLLLQRQMAMGKHRKNSTNNAAGEYYLTDLLGIDLARTKSIRWK